MDFRELFLTQHARAHAAQVGHPDFSNQDLVLRDLTDEHLRVRPHPGLNSLAWLFWHMTRAEDVGISLVIAQHPQVLDEDGWATRLNVSLRDMATGMTGQEVEEFSQQVNIVSLLAYRAAVGQQTQAIVRDLRPEVLDEKIESDLLRRIRDARVFGPDVISGQNPALILVWQAALIIGYVAYGHFYSRCVGPSSKNARRLLSGGGLALALGHFSFMSVLVDVWPYAEYLFLLVVVGVLCTLIGLIWFGILNLRQPVLGRWFWLPLFTGLMGLIGFVLFRGQEITTVFLVFRTLFALGLIGLGVLLWMEKPVQPAALQ